MILGGRLLENMSTKRRKNKREFSFLVNSVFEIGFEKMEKAGGDDLQCAEIVRGRK